MVRALIVAIVLSVLFAGSTAAQQSTTGIQATGTGTATAPAQTAHLQFLLGSSGSFAAASMEMAPGTPSAEMTDASFGMMSLTAAQLDPVVAAIVATGVSSDAIVVTVPTMSSIYGPGGPETGEIRVTIAQPQPGDLANLVAAVNTAAQQAGLSVFYVGARYDTADCAALTQQARLAAIADAKQRAEGLAQGLGITLGDLTLASEYPYYVSPGTGSCDSTGAFLDGGAYGPGTDPAFDPNATEVVVMVQVTLTYAFAETA